MNPKDSWLLDWDSFDDELESRESRKTLAIMDLMHQHKLQQRLITDLHAEKESKEKDIATFLRRALVEESSEVNSLSVELPNTAENIQKVLDLLENITFQQMVEIIQVDYLCEEDAGGQYLLAAKQEFVDMAKKVFRSATHLSMFYHPYNYVMVSAGDIALATMDTTDKYDVLMSLVDEEYAENIEDVKEVEAALRKAASNMVYALWDEVII